MHNVDGSFIEECTVPIHFKICRNNIEALFREWFIEVRRANNNLEALFNDVYKLEGHSH